MWRTLRLKWVENSGIADLVWVPEKGDSDSWAACDLDPYSYPGATTAARNVCI